MSAPLSISNSAALSTSKSRVQRVCILLSFIVRDEVEYYTETECETEYKEDCEYQWEGSGYNKVWAPIPGTCKNNAYDKCGDVRKQKLKQVPYQDCQNVPKQVSFIIDLHIP